MRISLGEREKKKRIIWRERERFDEKMKDFYLVNDWDIYDDAKDLLFLMEC